MTQTLPAGDAANTPTDHSDENKSDNHNPEDRSTDRAGRRGSASGRPSHDELLRRLGAAVPL